MPQSILYYPTINIEDTPWLRCAALYWDQVFSIVPDSEFYDYSPEVCYMMERGQYHPIYPQDVLALQYADAFSKEVMCRLRRTFTQVRQRRDSLHQRNFTPVFLNPILLHQAKIPHDTMRQMLQSGFIRFSDDQNWLEADQRVADIYMRTLAEYIVQFDKRDIVMGTDKQPNFDKLYHRNRMNLRGGTPLFEISLVDILPIPAPDVGFETILDFKERRQNELGELHRVIHELERNISHSESHEEIKTLLEDFRTQWKTQLRQAEKMFRGDGMGFAYIIGAGRNGLLRNFDLIYNRILSRQPE